MKEIKLIGSSIVLNKVFLLFDGIKYSDIFYTRIGNQILECKLQMVNEDIMVCANGKTFNQYRMSFYKTFNDCLKGVNPLRVIRKEMKELLNELGFELIDNKYISGFECGNCQVVPVKFSHNYLKINFDNENGFSVEIDRLYLKNVYFTEEEARKNLKIELITF